MDIVLRHILRGMSQHGADCEFRKSEVAGNTPEGVTKRMRRDAFDPCQAAYPLQAIADRGERAVANSRGNQMRVASNLRLRFEHTDCGGPHSPNLRPARGVGQHDIAARSEEHTSALQSLMSKS